MTVERPNQVWATDITYIPMARGFVYLVAVVDWFTRRVLSHRVSITMEAGFCVEALEEAIDKHGKPEIFNSDQGSQFTSEAFTSILEKNGIAISMDGKGSWRDNVFVERPWIPERSATRLREANLNVFSKLRNQGLVWRLEPKAFTGGEVGREDDLLDFLVGCAVDIQVARQPST